MLETNKFKKRKRSNSSSSNRIENIVLPCDPPSPVPSNNSNNEDGPNDKLRKFKAKMGILKSENRDLKIQNKELKSENERLTKISESSEKNKSSPEKKKKKSKKKQKKDNSKKENKNTENKTPVFQNISKSEKLKLDHFKSEDLKDSQEQMEATQKSPEKEAIQKSAEKIRRQKQPDNLKKVRFADEELKKIPAFIKVHRFDSEERASNKNGAGVVNFLQWDCIPIAGIPNRVLIIREMTPKIKVEEVKIHTHLTISPAEPVVDKDDDIIGDGKDKKDGKDIRPKIIPF